jgi:hypothetical protein
MHNANALQSLICKAVETPNLQSLTISLLERLLVLRELTKPPLTHNRLPVREDAVGAPARQQRVVLALAPEVLGADLVDDGREALLLLERPGLGLALV